MQENPFVLGFTAGELSPWLESRFDLHPYRRGVAELRNFFVQPYGGLRRRSGTRWAATLGSGDASCLRLFPFSFSESDRLMLLFMPGVMRVFRDGGLLTGEDGEPYSLALPAVTAEALPSLRFLQVNDCVFVTSQDMPPFRLLRYADTDWLCLPFSFYPYPRETYRAQSGELHVCFDGASSMATLRNYSSTDLFTAAMADRERVMVDSVQPSQLLFQGQTFATKARPLPDMSKTALDYGQVYYVSDAATGLYRFYQCIRTYTPADYTSSSRPDDYPKFLVQGAMRLSGGMYPYEVVSAWRLTTYGTWNAEWELWRSFDTIRSGEADPLCWRWECIASFSQGNLEERKNWALSGSERQPCRFVLVCKACSELTVPAMLSLRLDGGTREYEFRITEVKDANTARARLLSSYFGHPRSFVSRMWSFGAFGPRNGYPQFCCLYQGRLWFAGMPGMPTSLLASCVDDYYNFSVGSDADQALHLSLSTADQSRICWMCAARGLLLGTTRSEWTLTSSDSAALSATNAAFTRQSSVGAADLGSWSLENTVFYVQRGGRRLREISYKLEADAFTSTDTGLLAEHLFASGVKMWAVQSGADSRMWVLMQDGTLAVLVMNVEQEVTAWQRVEFQGREICALAVLPGGADALEELWLVLRHKSTGLVTVERYAEGQAYVDGAVKLSGAEDWPAFPHLADLQGWVYPVAAPEEALSCRFDEQGRPLLPPPSGKAYVLGAAYTSLMRTMPLESEVSYNAVRQFGRVRLRLLDSAPLFEFRLSTSPVWECFDALREHVPTPFTGSLRLSQMPEPRVGQSFALRCSSCADFKLLSLLLEVDYHGH